MSENARCRPDKPYQVVARAPCTSGPPLKPCLPRCEVGPRLLYDSSSILLSHGKACSKGDLRRALSMRRFSTKERLREWKRMRIESVGGPSRVRRCRTAE